MIEHFFVVFEQVIILFLLIIIGFIVFKKNLISEAGIPAINNFILFIVTPCVIMQAFYREYDAQMLSSLAVTFVCAICIHIGSIVLSHLLIHDTDISKERVFRFSAVFPNCGYMGLPLQLAILGNEGVFFGATYIAVFNIFSWTYGVALMGGRREISIKKVLINPGIIGVVLGLILFFTQIKLPAIFASVFSHLSALNTPLPMVIIGFYLAGITSFAVLKNWRLVLTLCLKLIIFPLLAIFSLYFMGHSWNYACKHCNFCLCTYGR